MDHLQLVRPADQLGVEDDGSNRTEVRGLEC